MPRPNCTGSAIWSWMRRWRTNAAGAPAERLHDPPADHLIIRIVDDSGGPPHFVYAAGNIVNAILRARMIAEESRDRAVSAPLHRQQSLEEVQHAMRVVPGAGHEIEAHVVALLLICAAEARHRPAGDNLRHDLRHDVRILTEKNAADDIDLLCLLHLLDCMPGYDMADFVRQHPRELVGLVCAGDQTGVDVNVTAGNAEGVHGWIADDFEVERPVRNRSHAVNALADHAHVRERLRVVDQPHLLRDLRSHLISKLPFLIEGTTDAESAGAAAGKENKKRSDKNERLLQHRNLRGRFVQFAVRPQRIAPCRRRISFAGSIGNASAVWPLPVTVVARSRELMIASSVASIVARKRGDI